MAKVSVIVTAHNYGKYLPQALDSVLKQNYDSYEIVVVNDGSTDDTAEILSEYWKKYPDKVKVVTLSGVGLAKAANVGVKESRGKYIIRLDADDYFDENILLVEANILDKNKNIHMVYPDYYRINKYGEIIDSYRLQKVNDEVKLLDRSPLAAGAMFRRKCFEALGGYNERLRYQEDYDFWIRFIDKFNVYNVNLPLLYYRKHDGSMSRNFDGRMKARRYVKKKFIESKNIRRSKKIIAVIPAMGLFRGVEKLALKLLRGKPLISYAIKSAIESSLVSRVIVSTEDREIADAAVSYGADIPFLRPVELARTSVPVSEVLKDLIVKIEDDPDYIAILNYFSPFIAAEHIDEAIDTILLYNTDSVISVTADITYHWHPGMYGLKPIWYRKRLLREDRETIYKETGSVYVIKKENIYSENYLGDVVGHIELSEREAWRVDTDFNFKLAEEIMQKGL